MSQTNPHPIVRTEIDGSLARITLGDVARRNALSNEMFDGLEQAIAKVAREGCIAVALEADGPAFCAGFDLRAAVEEVATLESFIERLSRLARGLRRLEAVTIAAVQGPALAGGAALVASCDLLLVTPEARIGYPAVRLGISPAVSLPTLLPTVGAGKARAMLLAGELVTGRDALASGWASGLAENPDSLLELVESTLRRLASSGPESLRATKRWLGGEEGTDSDADFDRTMQATLALAGGEECRSRMKAALEATSSSATSASGNRRG
ncbi:MAG: enoyl-CoA hydratase/isomerase family protein [Phycisphaerales bacterium]|jgi:methylglutaconyl-CoA hydratase